MNELLNHPAIQAAVIPFFVGVILAIILIKIRTELSSLALLAGFLVTCYLITDLSLQPLTSTKKLVLLTVFTAILSVARLFLPSIKKPLLIALIFGSAFAIAWLLWPVLSRKELVDAAFVFLPLVIFCIAVLMIAISNTHSTQSSALELRGVAIIFALVTSISCLIGASALYGQMAAALSASAAAILLVSFLFPGSNPAKQIQSDELFAILLFLPVSLIAIAGSVYAKLPIYVLPFLVGIPATLMIRLSHANPWWKQLLVRIGLTFIPGGLAIYFTWDAAGPVPF